MKFYRAAKDRKLVAHLTVQVAPGFHQKIETLAHLLAELQSSLSTQCMGTFPGCGESLEWEAQHQHHHLALGLPHLFFQEAKRTENIRVDFFLAVFNIWFFLYLLLPLLSLGRDIQNILNLI